MCVGKYLLSFYLNMTSELQKSLPKILLQGEEHVLAVEWCTKSAHINDVLGSWSEICLSTELPGDVLGGCDCNVCLAVTKLLKEACKLSSPMATGWNWVIFNIPSNTNHSRTLWFYDFHTEDKKHPLFKVRHLTFHSSPWFHTKAVEGRIT